MIKCKDDSDVAVYSVSISGSDIFGPAQEGKLFDNDGNGEISAGDRFELVDPSDKRAIPKVVHVSESDLAYYQRRLKLGDIKISQDGVCRTKEVPNSNGPGQKRYATLLIDANYPEGPFDQQRNLNGVWNLNEEMSNMKEVLEEANRANTRVYEIYIAHGSPDYKPSTDPMFKALRQKNWIIFPKPTGDAFENTGLEQELRKDGITDLIVIGRNQSACVLWTAESALKNGFVVHASLDTIQADGSNVLYNLECEVKRDASKESVPCRSLVGQEIPDDTVVKPMREYDGAGFYKEKTDLVDCYKDLPIFKK